MKGITVWIWMVAGVIVGLLLFTVFVQLLGITTTTRQIQMAKTTFDELATNANSFCGTFGVAKISRTYKFPEIVTGIYATDSGKSLHVMNGRTYGNVVCMNATRELDCQNIECQVEMSSLTSTNKLSTILDRLSGGFQTTDFQLDVEKTECGVSILNSGESPSELCGGKSNCNAVYNLVRCQSHNIISLVSANVLVMADFTPIFDCCDNYPNTPALLGNVARFFGGSKIMVVWESNFANPRIQKYSRINDTLTAGGFEMISFKHRQNLAQGDLNGMDQVWIYLPGWCSGQADVQRTVECTDFVEWADAEYALLKSFVSSGGKIFIVTDYSPYTTQSVVNNILSSLSLSAKVSETKVCGDGTIVNTTDIQAHPITANINQFGFLATSEITCQ